MYLNKVFLFGRLGQDPELRALPSGTQVASFTLATNRYYNKDGQRQEETQWHNIVVFGKQADLVKQYLKKGDSVLVEGRIQTRSWTGQDKQKRYRTEIIAERIQFGPRTQSAQSDQAPKMDEIKADENAEPSVADIEYPEDINPDDIPF